MGKVYIFSIPTCKHCKKAKGILKNHNVEYQDIDVSDPDLRNACIKMSGKFTVPQIYFNDKHIGGASDLEEIEKAGNLPQVLKEVIAAVETKNFIPEIFLNPQEKVSKTSEELEQEKSEADKLAEILEKEVDDVIYEARKKESTLSIKDRTYHLRKFKNCFIGKEFVDWLIKNGYPKNRVNPEVKAPTRTEAESFGQLLLDRHNIHHVANSEPFKDGYFFYRFQADAQEKVLNMTKIFIGKPRNANPICQDIRKIILKLNEKFIDPSGSKVDYKGMKASPIFQKEYLNAVTELQKVDLSLLSPDERKAFFINIYNSLVIHGFIAVGQPKNIYQRVRFFFETSYNIGGNSYSLQAIENGILRGNKRPPGSLKRMIRGKDPRRFSIISKIDPRIHFGLNCGSKSCPPIKVFSLENINEELEIAAKAFCETEVQIDVTKRKVTTSKIFKWYKSDFGRNDEEVIDFLCKYLPAKQAALIGEMKKSKKTIKLKYSAYDWGVNEK